MVNIPAMATTRAIQEVGRRTVTVVLDVTKGLMVEASGKPAEIIAYGAATALVALGCAAAGIVISSIRGADGYRPN